MMMRMMMGMMGMMMIGMEIWVYVLVGGSELESQGESEGGSE